MQNDLISRSALLKEFEKRQEQQTNKYCDCFLNDAQELSTEWWCVEDAVIAAPTIDAVEVVHAEWLTNSDVPDTLICSKCGRRFDMYFFDQKDMPYCLCGAKMDGGAEC